MRSSRGIRTRRAWSRVVGAGVAGVVVVGVVLAGCTTEPGPEPSAPETTAATTTESTATPTPTESVAPETVKPERPEAMDEVSVEGAEAVARYFLELYDYVYATSDLDTWETLSHPECVFCASVSEDVKKSSDNGETSEGGELSLLSSTAAKISAAKFSAEVKGRQAPWTAFGPDGEVTAEQEESEDHIFYFSIWRTGGEWSVRAVQVDDPPK